MTKWRMRIACWIPKATHIQSEYVIRVAFPQQQWLGERASVLSLYLHYLSCLQMSGSLRGETGLILVSLQQIVVCHYYYYYYIIIIISIIIITIVIIIIITIIVIIIIIIIIIIIVVVVTIIMIAMVFKFKF